MNITCIFCLCFSIISMIMDLKWEKVSNVAICIGVAVSLFLCLSGMETKSLPEWFIGLFIPLLLLFPLFFCRMLGTGDIKVFMVLGSAMGGKVIIYSIIISFLAGAVIAIPVLLFRCNTKERFVYFFTYLNHVLVTKTFPPYLAPGKHPENIHFTVPVFCSVLLLILKGEIM